MSAALIDQLLRLPPDERTALLASFTDEEAMELIYDWRLWARPNQLPPERAHTYWLLLAGRGFGKTRTGAEWTRMKAKDMPGSRGALIAPTAADARDVMVEGESGIIACSPPWFMPNYEPSKRRLTWPNGSQASTFSSEDPESLRGPQHHWGWCDEMAAWAYMQDTWDMFMFGLRLGVNPQACISTTPKPFMLLKELLEDPDTIATTGSTYDNKQNLSGKFFEKIIKRYEGTRIGRQELNAELLFDNPGALFRQADIDKARVAYDRLAWALAQCKQVVIGVDPAVSTNESSDETGIIIAGRDGNDHGFVFYDHSGKFTPDGWATCIDDEYRRLQCDRVVPEVNNGGDMVEHTMRTKNKFISVHPVRATRGKVTRAEPIAALYEQGRIHHVGEFAKLEEQMTSYDPLTSKKSPDRMDALVWALSYLFNEESVEPSIRRL